MYSKNNSYFSSKRPVSYLLDYSVLSQHNFTTKYTLLFYKNNFIRTEALILTKNLRTKPDLLSHRKNKLPRLSICKIARTKYQNSGLVLLSHFNIAKLSNDHIIPRKYTFQICLFIIHWTVKPHPGICHLSLLGVWKK